MITTFNPNPFCNYKSLFTDPWIFYDDNVKVYRRLFGFRFAFHLSYPNLVAAKTPSVKKKPPMYRNKIEPVNNPHAKPIVALTNSNITNTTHLSTNEERTLGILLTVFSSQKFLRAKNMKDRAG